MLGLSRVVYVYVAVVHVHCSSHYGIMISCGYECWFLMFTNV